MMKAHHAAALMLACAPLLADPLAAHAPCSPAARHTPLPHMSAQLLRFAGDLTARIAFEPNLRARRRSAARSAQAVRMLADDFGNADADAASTLRALADGLAAYDLLQIEAASRRRAALELHFRRLVP